ncbi:barH-like 1 homeobox protein [Pseudochaenichthys georgianus]|uniref:barH-like 1 homeobox protein n=1 Tax=Pseudochaenichthys georgianus TaxID=52239 RepID=UPI00146A5BE5|nr:barH-like 1 homeobox protein [Pseudochaenichthys georgianus]
MELPAFCRGCSEPRPPLREPAPWPQSAPRPGPSFLIRDILADCRPLCDPVPVLCDPIPVLCDPVPVLCDPVPVLCDPGGFRDRSLGSSSPDSEFRESGVQRLKKGRKARTAFSEQQAAPPGEELPEPEVPERPGPHEAGARAAAERHGQWKRQSVGMELMFLPPHFLFPPAAPTLDMYLYRGHAPLYHQAPAPNELNF